MKERITLGVLLVVYVAIATGIGRFTTTDEIAFKAAGREWAQSGRFAAPELTGFGPFDPPVEKIWLAHLPLYTFLFGLFVKLLGFGPVQSVLFDALIHALLAWLTFLLCARLAPHSRRWPLVAALLVLPLGTFGRADELAICFGMTALIALHDRRVVLAGICFGLAAGTSVPAATLLALCALPRRVRDLAVIAIAGAVTAIVCIAPVVIAEPTALRQFTQHAGGQFRDSLGWALAHSWQYGKPYLLGALAPLALAPYAWRRFAIPGVAALIVIFFVPAKSYYLWFVTPLLFAAACATLAERPLRIAPSIAVALYLIAIARPLQQHAIMATLPADQRLAPNAAKIRALVPRGSTIVASELWSALANDYEYRSLVHANVREPDYVILTGNGTGAPGRAQKTSFDPARYELIHDTLRRDAAPFSNSGWGYGTVILRRADAEGSPDRAP